MTISDVLSLFLGISLFLFGMSLMGDGLKRISDNRLGPILYKLSATPLKGVLLGSGVTAIIQSSSATSVIVVGLVNSGMMNLSQAISVVLGAIFGTSITGWVICLSYIEGTGQLSSLLSTATLTGLVAIAGILLRTFGRKNAHRHLGDIMMGFAILMVGMSTMSDSVIGLKEQPWFTAALTSMTNPAFGILVGIVVSALLQSASAAVGIVQALSVTGQVTFQSALPLLMGISIGAALPVMLSSLGAQINGKRTALSYLVSCIMGVMTTASIYYILDAMLSFPFTDLVMNPFTLALVNTIFRLVMICILLPFTDVLEALVVTLVPDKHHDDPNVITMNERFIKHPSLAIEQCKTVIADMARQASASVIEASVLIGRYNEEGFARVFELEDRGDHFEDVLGSYLMKLSEQDLSEFQSQELSLFLHTLSDLERISDHALNIAESAKEIHEKNLAQPVDAAHELSLMISAVREILQLTVTAFTTEDPALSERVEPLEEVIDTLCDRMKLNHVERLQTGNSNINQGFVFNDLLTNYERISDHCSNIAVAVIEIYSGTFATHEYLNTIKAKRTDNFNRYYDEYLSRFALPEA